MLVLSHNNQSDEIDEQDLSKFYETSSFPFVQLILET